MPSARTVCTAPGCEKPEHARKFCRTHYRINLMDIPPCTVADCDNPKSYRDGLCGPHGQRLRKTGSLTRPPRATTCAVDGCDSPRSEPRALCVEHRNIKRRTGTTDPAAGYTPEILDAFAATIERGEPDECWPWPGSRQKNKDGRPAYGLVGGAYAHRVSHHVHHGPIPEGLLVLHACDNPPCVNPRHLRAGTSADNIRDAVERGRHFTPWRREVREVLGRLEVTS